MHWPLIIALIILIIVSAFFSGSETSMMSLNRFRLRYLAKKRHRRAMSAQRMLKRPDRLLGVILIGNTFANILASAIATILAAHFFGDTGVFITTLILTAVILIFAEVMPKTFAALYAEKFAFRAVIILSPLQKLLYPLVWLINSIANALLIPFGVSVKNKKADRLTTEELRNVVTESTAGLAGNKKSMLIGILDLEHTTIQDIMVPRHKILGIDLGSSFTKQLKALKSSAYSRLPAYQQDINQTIGLIDLRKAIQLLGSRKLSQQTLRNLVEPAYFIPESTSLQQQLINFQQRTERMALVVNEYGDIQGLVTVEDILEEIVGEFTSLSQPCSNDATQTLDDGSYIVDAEMTVRDLNRDLGFSLPIDGPKTLSGLILEHLQTLPSANTCLLIAGHPIEVLQVKENAIRQVRIQPATPLPQGQPYQPFN